MNSGCLTVFTFIIETLFRVFFRYFPTSSLLRAWNTINLVLRHVIHECPPHSKSSFDQSAAIVTDEGFAQSQDYVDCIIRLPVDPRNLAPPGITEIAHSIVTIVSSLIAIIMSNAAHLFLSSTNRV
jgi:hypothetical protein